jgi:hypothetical protein
MDNPHNGRIEGSSTFTLLKLIKRHGYNRGDIAELGTVISPPPNLRINIDGMKIDLENDDFIVAEHVLPLTAGERVIILSAEGNQQYYVIGKVAY